jgi:predicted DNA-binding transcriptional regulator YafY
VLAALEEGADVRIRYAGARGLTERQVTPFDIDDARLHAWCHLREDERAFWLTSIQAASPVD